MVKEKKAAAAQWMKDLERVIELAGSLTAAAKFLNVARETLYSWKRPDGTRPGGAQRRLLELAVKELESKAEA